MRIKTLRLKTQEGFVVDAFFKDTYYINEKFDDYPAAGDNRGASEHPDDGDGRRNLLLNKKYMVRSLAPLDIAMRNEHANTQPDSGILTNGKYFSEDEGYNSRQLFRISIGVAREIVFDLNRVCTADTIRIGFIYIPSAGVRLPSKIVVSFSEDGKEWRGVIADNPTHSGGAVKQIYEKSFVPRAARYVKLTLHVFSFIAVDEVELYGLSRVVRQPTIPEPVVGMINFPEKFPPKDTLGGCRNILTVIDYLPDRSGKHRWTKEYFLPLVAYCCKNGSIKDTLFDTFLFLPKNNQDEDGAYVSCGVDGMGNFAEWLEYKNRIFGENGSLWSLNAAAAEYRNLTGDENFSVNVILPTLTTARRGEAFGDVDGDGRTEDFYDADGRIKILTHWTELLLDAFAGCRFPALKLAGFYWHDESIPYDDDIYSGCLKNYSDFIHRKGYKLVWGPWYQAPGIGCWHDYGFDYISMKPNYTWKDAFTVERLKSGIAVSKFIGAGVQLEIHPMAVEEEMHLRKYRSHLKYCHLAGCQKTVSTFYQGIAPGEFYKSSVASSPLYRSLYDDTYKFIKSRLREREFELKRKVFATETNKSLRAKLNAGRGSADVLFSVSGAAMHGIVKMTCDGRMTYYPDRGFYGIDSFIVNLSDTMSSQNEKILITVKRSQNNENS